MNSSGYNPPAHLQFGVSGENAAQAYLQDIGYEILARNWRFGKLELDLVCGHGGQIIFVEVKTRRSSNYGGPLAAMTDKKIKNLLHAAQAWLYSHNFWETPCRFDVLCLIGEPGNFHMEHYRNAFGCE